MVRTGGSSIPLGQLTLVPLVSMAGILTKDSLNSVSIGEFAVGGKSTEFFITPPPKPPMVVDGLQHIASGIASPFWWVSSTPTKAVANMEQSLKTVKGIDIPVLKNKVALPPYTRLWKLGPSQGCAIQH